MKCRATNPVGGVKSRKSRKEILRDGRLQLSLCHEDVRRSGGIATRVLNLLKSWT